MLSDETISKLKKLSKFIGEIPGTFDMSAFARKTEGNICGTSCCLGGSAVLLFDPKFYLKNINDGAGRNLEARACKVLGLTPKQGDALFYFDTKTNSVPKARRAITKFIKNGGTL